MTVASRELLRKFEVAEALERLCQSLELTAAQFLQAKERYERVGSWLDGANDPVLRALAIYLQGSTAIGTTVRPINRNEHDVDLIAQCPDVSPRISPAVLKSTIGERLRRNQHYARILEEKARCWRLSYANEFHMDITPAIPNPRCPHGGELVPDKELKEWSPSNPKGYRKLFERRAALAPSVPLTLSIPEGLRAEVETYPRLGGRQRHPASCCANREAASRPIFLRERSEVRTDIRNHHYYSCITELRALCPDQNLRQRVRFPV